jgi:hypothetical protein
MNAIEQARVILNPNDHGLHKVYNAKKAAVAKGDVVMVAYYRDLQIWLGNKIKERK